jgi:hypothetical protein
MWRHTTRLMKLFNKDAMYIKTVFDICTCPYKRNSIAYFLKHKTGLAIAFRNTWPHVRNCL